jgi:hypothetical protein
MSEEADVDLSFEALTFGSDYVEKVALSSTELTKEDEEKNQDIKGEVKKIIFLL